MIHGERNSSWLRRLVRNTDGASAIEFAIVAPPFLLLMLGVICYGIYFGSVHGVQQLAAEGARAAIAGISNSERKSLAQSAITQSIGSYPFLTQTKLSITSVDTDPATGTFTVSLHYDASDLPIFHLPSVIVPSKTIARSASVQRGGF